MDMVFYVHRFFFIVVFTCQVNGIRGLRLPSVTLYCQDRVTSWGQHYGAGYLPDNYFCNSLHDCYSGEDKGVGCVHFDLFRNTTICAPGQIYCDQGKCKNITVRCNTIRDCQDGTDEMKCGEVINVKNCTQEDKYLCRDGLRCLGLEYTCNDECNCFDCSDENENCTKNDFELMNRCHHAYFVTAHGPQCLCNFNNNTSSRNLCNSIKNCDDQVFEELVKPLNYCGQRCIQFGVKTQCTCYQGYHMEDHQCTSKAAGQALLLYLKSGQSDEIESWDINTEKISLIVGGLTKCTLFTASKNYVYYVTFSQNGTATISKALFHARKSEKLIEMNFYIRSIAVDYITNNIYFTGNGSLLVCTNDGQICKQLKCCGVGYVSLNPQRGFMFYTLQTGPNEEFTVIRSNLDGSNETTITDNLYQGNVSIKVEESRNALFLSHEKVIGEEQVLEEISIESSERVTDVSWSHLPNFQSFSPYKNSVFFIIHAYGRYHYVIDVAMNSDRYDWLSTRYIEDIDIQDLHFGEKLKELYVYDKAIQYSEEDPCNKSACSGLCLLKPEMHSAYHFLSFTCICEGFTPKNGNHWCSNEIAPEVYHGVFWIVASIMVVIILGIVAAYFVVKKKNWYFYYLTLREWQLSKRGERIIQEIEEDDSCKI